MDRSDKIVMWGVIAAIAAVFITFGLMCRSDNKEEILCETAGGTYVKFYKSKNLCFRSDILIDVKRGG